MANPVRLQNLSDTGRQLGWHGISAIRPFLLGAMVAVGNPDVGADSRFQPAMDNDFLLEERIERRLAWDRELAPFRLAAKVNEAVVTVVGTVSTSAESHRARRTANEVTGVFGIVNGVTIDPALAHFAGTLLARPDDRTLERRIAVSFADDTRVEVGDIEVQVSEGRVSLTGSVDDVADKARAETIVRSLFGVRSLSNEIQWFRTLIARFGRLPCNSRTGMRTSESCSY